MFKIFLSILKDESGAWWVPAAIMAAGAISKAAGGKNKQKTYDPYSALRGDYQGWLQGKLGTSTPYKQNEAFDLDQPEIEKALEGTILGGLKRGAGLKTDIFGTMQKYQQARIGELKKKEEEDVIAGADVYNRLGLVSSSPWLAQRSDIKSDYADKMNMVTADISREGIGYEMDATRLSEEVLNQYMNQGQILGGAQRGYQKYSQQMSMQDIMRMVEEEMGYGQQAGDILGSNPPQMWMEPNMWSQLGDAGMQIGGGMMMSQILGGGGGSQASNINKYGNKWSSS